MVTLMALHYYTTMLIYTDLNGLVKLLLEYTCLIWAINYKL